MISESWDANDNFLSQEMELWNIWEVHNHENIRNIPKINNMKVWRLGMKSTAVITTCIGLSV